MICQYIAFKESIQQAHYNNLREPSEENQNALIKLILQDDERWQEMVNYIYQYDPKQEN
jgi:hypothetical protein